MFWSGTTAWYMYNMLGSELVPLVIAFPILFSNGTSIHMLAKKNSERQTVYITTYVGHGQTMVMCATKPH